MRLSSNECSRVDAGSPFCDVPDVTAWRGCVVRSCDSRTITPEIRAIPSKNFSRLPLPPLRPLREPHPKFSPLPRFPHVPGLVFGVFARLHLLPLVRPKIQFHQVNLMLINGSAE
jgi:hypothetical protein